MLRKLRPRPGCIRYRLSGRLRASGLPPSPMERPGLAPLPIHPGSPPVRLRLRLCSVHQRLIHAAVSSQRACLLLSEQNLLHSLGPWLRARRRATAPTRRLPATDEGASAGLGGSDGARVPSGLCVSALLHPFLLHCTYPSQILEGAFSKHTVHHFSRGDDDDFVLYMACLCEPYVR